MTLSRPIPGNASPAFRVLTKSELRAVAGGGTGGPYDGPGSRGEGVGGSRAGRGSCGGSAGGKSPGQQAMDEFTECMKVSAFDTWEQQQNLVCAADAMRTYIQESRRQSQASSGCARESKSGRK